MPLMKQALYGHDRTAQAQLETELSLARRVQMHLLPSAPRLPGLGLFACTRPASHVGGDYFDFVSGPDGSMTLVVGDVSGKGMPAALVMTMTRTIMRSVAGQAQRASGFASYVGPGTLLARANHELYEDLSELEMFVTVFAAQHCPDSRSLLFANAGHSPVVYRPAGGTARLLQADIPPLGVLPATAAADRTLEFGPGDLLIAASDGLNETRNAAGQMFGIARMLACIEANSHLSAEALGHALFAAVEAYRAGQQEDDLTLVVMKGVAA